MKPDIALVPDLPLYLEIEYVLFVQFNVTATCTCIHYVIFIIGKYFKRTQEMFLFSINVQDTVLSIRQINPTTNELVSQLYHRSKCKMARFAISLNCIKRSHQYQQRLRVQCHYVLRHFCFLSSVLFFSYYIKVRTDKTKRK